MRTQISNLINGSENTIRNLSAEKYIDNPIGFYCGKSNVPQNGGTPAPERLAIANAVSAENPAEMRVIARGINLTLSRRNSTSGKSWSWRSEITPEQYKTLTGDDAPVWTHNNAVNHYALIIHGSCTVEVEANDGGKKGYYRVIGEEFIEIL